MLPTTATAPVRTLFEIPAVYVPSAALEELWLGAAEEEDAAVATVKTCPANEVVEPDSVASVIAGPPTDVTSTTGAPSLAVTIVANACDVDVPRTEVTSARREVAVLEASTESATEPTKLVA